jgi:cystathionine gamma-synthase
VRTLFARMRVHEENAHAVARALAEHPNVLAVHYPGLPSHPGHRIAAGQQGGFGAMVSFTLRGGRDGVERVTAALTCFTLAESLGGVESLVAHPATMTHASMDAAARQTAGITDGLLRLSVGIELAEDLVADLVQALDLAEDVAAGPVQGLDAIPAAATRPGARQRSAATP